MTRIGKLALAHRRLVGGQAPARPGSTDPERKLLQLRGAADLEDEQLAVIAVFGRSRRARIARSDVDATPAREHRDILHAVDRIGNGRRDDAGLDVLFPDLLARVGLIGIQCPSAVPWKTRLPAVVSTPPLSGAG